MIYIEVLYAGTYHARRRRWRVAVVLIRAGGGTHGGGRSGGRPRVRLRREQMKGDTALDFDLLGQLRRCFPSQSRVVDWCLSATYDNACGLFRCVHCACSRSNTVMRYRHARWARGAGGHARWAGGVGGHRRAHRWSPERLIAIRRWFLHNAART